MTEIVDVALEEYRLLDAEAQATTGRQRQSLQLGVTALGVTIGLGAQLGNHPRTSAVVLAGVVPVVAAASLLLWAVEAEHRARIGLQQVANESAVNRLVGAPILEWQRRQAMEQMQRPGISSRTAIVAVIFFALAAF